MTNIPIDSQASDDFDKQTRDEVRIALLRARASLQLSQAIQLQPITAGSWSATCMRGSASEPM